MNTNTQKFVASPRALQADALHNRLAVALAARLQDGTVAVPHEIGERLRFGRERALAAATQQRRLAAVQAQAAVLGSGGQQLALGGWDSRWWRLASVLPLVVLIVGLVLIQMHHDNEQIAVAAEIDSALLADELPPDAYGDPGFSEFLRGGPTP